MNLKSTVMRLNPRLSLPCLLPAAVFLAASLTPSLLPRPMLLQAVLSGLSFAIGYGLGAGWIALWRYLGLPALGGRMARASGIMAAVICVSMVVAGLWHTVHWQNSLREIMGMEKLTGLQPLVLVPVAVATFFLLLVLARVFRWLSVRASRGLARHVPPRVSRVVAVAVTAMLFWFAINGLLFGFLLRVADRSFQEIDARIDDDLPRPTLASQTGSPESLVDWRDLGHQGRTFVSGCPTAAELEEFFGTPVPVPVRVYVGLNSADSPEQRARMALDELKRAGGFERSVLLLVTPTGTGWVDPAGQDPVEYLHRGDIATVAVQYSYLNSPLALMTQAQYGVETARALFQKVYGYWRSLPSESRPRLYLNGLSLGSLNSDHSFDLYDIIDDPFHGALWSGPPFRHQTWREATARRDPGTPPWRPEFRKGAVVRFMNQGGVTGAKGNPWGKFRILFLQYPSDPITFFSPAAAWRAPDWMDEPRGKDVSPSLRWFPVVTMLQLAIDMAVGTAPEGFGHTIAASDYIEAWLALTEPPGWDEAALARLRAFLKARDDVDR
jgi:uncharacterized membrane protein